MTETTEPPSGCSPRGAGIGLFPDPAGDHRDLGFVTYAPDPLRQAALHDRYRLHCDLAAGLAPFWPDRGPGMTDVRDIDVLILGAGINGAGLFRDLCEQGVTCALIDKGDFGSGHVRSPVALNPWWDQISGNRRVSTGRAVYAGAQPAFAQRAFCDAVTDRDPDLLLVEGHSCGASYAVWLDHRTAKPGAVLIKQG